MLEEGGTRLKNSLMKMFILSEGKGSNQYASFWVINVIENTIYLNHANYMQGEGFFSYRNDNLNKMWIVCDVLKDWIRD